MLLSERPASVSYLASHTGREAVPYAGTEGFYCNSLQLWGSTIHSCAFNNSRIIKVQPANPHPHLPRLHMAHSSIQCHVSLSLFFTRISPDSLLFLQSSLVYTFCYFFLIFIFLPSLLIFPGISPVFCLSCSHPDRDGLGLTVTEALLLGA